MTGESDVKSLEEPSPALLEQYRLAVEMADRVSARRTSANSFFATIHTALVAVFASVFVSPDIVGTRAEPDAVAVVAVAVVGVALAATWFLLIRSYRDLNAAKFEVILEIEKQLPAQPFTDEWECLRRDPVARWRGRYAEFNTLERVVPIIFGAVYVLAAVAAILG